jgi:TolB-like protein
MTGFFEEVKRRKVYRVAAAYIIAAGGIIQLASATFPAWELPSWALRLVILLVLAGFPIALILAWAFDITAQGIQATPDTAAPRTRRRRNIVMLIATGMVISAATGFFLLPRVAAHKVDKSIAVLPFENLSDEKENAYFADGIQDDVLTNLSKISDLRVISRTSVMQYRGRPTNLREIGKALGVSNILEGSVRRSGNKVRVNVQLIDASTDEHVWANDYDGDVTDVFAIQTDLAQKIANELRAKLSPGEKERMERKPTENGEAYQAFVQAHDLSCAMEDLTKLKQSEQLYQRAVDLDPNFALALARYSQLESWMLRTHEGTPEHRDKARSLAERAFQLQPELPEAHLALGFSYYYGDNNYEAALRELEAYLAIGAIQRRQGKWAESTANLEKAASLNPKDTWLLQNLVFNYQMQRKFDAANKTVDRALQISPQGMGLWEIKVKLAIAEKGDFSVYEQGVEKDAFKTVPGSLALKYFAIGIAQKNLGDDAAARVALVKAKNIFEEQLKQKPDDADLRVQLAKLLAWLGEKDAAVAEAQRATDLRPESKDAFEGPRITEGVAQVYAILGDNARAIELLDELLNRPSEVTLQTLKLNPAWDPIRNDPAFQALFAKYAGKA